MAAGQEQGGLLKSMPRRGRFHLSAGSSQLSKGDLYADELCEPHENMLIFLLEYFQSALGILTVGQPAWASKDASERRGLLLVWVLKVE